MEKYYSGLMAKVLDKGHAVSVAPEEISSRESSGQLWYLLRRLERVFLVAIVIVKRWKIPKKDNS